jgi:hypothetical protein
MTLPTAADRLPAVSAPVRLGLARAWARRLGLLAESKPALIGTGIVLFWVLAAVLAPVVAPYPPNANHLAAVAHPTPSATHWLGTDHLGRDILSRILWGARTVLTVAPLAVLGAAILGSLLGLTAGYYRGWIDLVIVRACDIVLSFPVIILYMIILAHFGSSALNIIAVLTLTKAPIITRIVRGLTIELREREYVATLHHARGDPAQCARTLDRGHVPAHRIQRRDHRGAWLSGDRPAAARSRLGRHGQGHVRHDVGLATHGALPLRSDLLTRDRLQPARRRPP